jgi:hypothetical protein
MKVLFDRSVSIREAIDDVQFTLILAGFLVLLVILLFLRNLSATTDPQRWRCRFRSSAPSARCRSLVTASTIFRCWR